MSLSPWEQDALDSIKNGLADSDPGLVARLAMFTRLAAGEAMPVRDKLQAVSQRVARRGARRSRRLYQRLNLGRAMLLVWLVTTLTLIAAALATSRASAETCAGPTSALCGGATTAPQTARPFP
jgi:predicted metal-binding membrane protein